MNKIEYQNCWNLCFKKTTNKLFNMAVVKKFGNSSKNFFANIKFVSENEIKQLNNKFRQIDRATDVLSFPNYDFEKETIEGEQDVFLGDIAICKPIAKKQAKVFNHGLKRELCFLALHGILHLMGFDHLTDSQEKEMMDFAEEILKENGVERWKQDMLP